MKLSSLHVHYIIGCAHAPLTRNSVDQEDLNTGEVIPGEWRQEQGSGLPSITPQGSNNYERPAERVRTAYREYFWIEGAIPQQWLATGLTTGIGDNEEGEYSDNDF